MGFIEHFKDNMPCTIPDEPKDCRKEYDYDVCEDCTFREFEYVSHPGGESTQTVEKSHCKLGHWKDDF